jgi:glycosyltransferase involved in cell wall biosynthesis
MRILITTVSTPFVRGGAEIHAEGLCRALVREGHQAELVTIPFKHYPPERILDNMLACRLIDITESSGLSVDKVIGLKFPAYFIPHPNKTLWILHQHREAYDLWDNPLCGLRLYPNGLQVREAIIRADRNLIPEGKSIYANSLNVSKRLKKFCGIDSIPLYHPPYGFENFFCGDPDDYFFYPSRIWPIKRQSLVLDALALTREPVCVRFAGIADNPNYEKKLKDKAKKLGLTQRTQWMGEITEEEKYSQYAHCLGVVFPPIDEDYGYITLESMLSSKPVITLTDSGGPLEFVRHRETGLIVEPTPKSLAEAFDEIWQNRKLSGQWGISGRDLYESLNINWSSVVEKLLS